MHAATKPLFPLRLLQDERTLREVHHLLWMDPHINKGTLDHGWNCRDHAWISALLMKTAGHEPFIFHGKAAFVAPRKKDSEGLVIEQDPHTWCGVNDLGCFDLSIKPDTTALGERFRLPMNLLYANRILPASKAALAVVRDEQAYRRTLSSTLQENKSAAIYLLSRGEEFDPALLAQSAAWINSPLTDRLKLRSASPAATYCAMAIHLIGFLRGRQPTLSIFSQDETWDRLAQDADSALVALQNLLSSQ